MPGASVVSTIPVQGAGFTSPGRKSRVAERWNRHLVRKSLVHVRRDLWNVPRYLMRYSLLVLAVLGLLGLWDAYGDGHIPMSFPLRNIDPNRHSSRQCASLQVDDSAHWLGLAPSLSILDEVNPAVAAWVRQRHDQGTLVFSDRYCVKQGDRGAMAKYDHIQHKLTVQRALFEENDGTVAAILCHEYRHSRQNLAKIFRYVLSSVFATHGDASIVENDAELYEHEARVAIFGQ